MLHAQLSHEVRHPLPEAGGANLDDRLFRLDGRIQLCAAECPSVTGVADPRFDSICPHLPPLHCGHAFCWS